MGELLPFLALIVLLGLVTYASLLLIAKNAYSVWHERIYGQFQKWQRERLMRAANDSHYYPTVGVVVYTHNNEKTIESTLRTLSKSRHPTREIICLDNHSTDMTLMHIRKARHELSFSDFEIRIENSVGDVQALLTDTLQHMESDFVLVIDGASVVQPQTITQLLDRALHARSDIVVAMQSTYFTPSFISLASILYRLMINLKLQASHFAKVLYDYRVVRFGALYKRSSLMLKETGPRTLIARDISIQYPSFDTWNQLRDQSAIDTRGHHLRAVIVFFASAWLVLYAIYISVAEQSLLLYEYVFGLYFGWLLLVLIADRVTLLWRDKIWLLFLLPVTLALHITLLAFRLAYQGQSSIIHFKGHNTSRTIS